MENNDGRLFQILFLLQNKVNAPIYAKKRGESSGLSQCVFPHEFLREALLPFPSVLRLLAPKVLGDESFCKSVCKDSLLSRL